MSIQILQYEFLGPIKLDDWGPPMEKVVYLILSRVKDTFNTIFVSDCEKTDDVGFFTKNPSFKCWIENSGSEKSLYLAILPMFDSEPSHRKQVISKILTRYRPACNMKDIPEPKPDYVVRPKLASDGDSKPEILCPCCGTKMQSEKILEKSILFKCPECGLSDTRLNP